MVQGTDANVWKEIAIGKQILLKTVTDALGIEDACSEEELEVALAEGVRQISKAGSIVSQAKKDRTRCSMPCCVTAPSGLPLFSLR